MQGRHILWGWLQERRKVGTYEYAGCLTVPRVLYLRGNSLVQEPVRLHKCFVDHLDRDVPSFPMRKQPEELETLTSLLQSEMTSKHVKARC